MTQQQLTAAAPQQVDTTLHEPVLQRLNDKHALSAVGDQQHLSVNVVTVHS